MLLTPADTSVTSAPRHGTPSMGGLGWLAIAIAFLAPFLLYFDTAKSIVTIWNHSDTFAHGYIILPISLWLIWRRRANFIAMPPQPWWPPLILLVLIGFGWLLARMGEVQVVMQYALVSMFPVIALALFGRRLAWSLAFPLLFLLLAVPFGEIFIDPLVAFTADFTVSALQLVGIPVLRNGSRFEIPSGSWSVVEACSGVRYLISSVTLGLLYAYLTYGSTWRRLSFLLVSIVVPIVANGIRAFTIVLIGHFSGMTLAVGFDHIIYGWVFFGLVMFLMFWIGSFWREDDTPGAHSATGGAVPVSVPMPGSQSTAPAPTPASTKMLLMAGAIVLITALGPLLATVNDRATANANPVRLGSIDIKWPAAQSPSAWTPRFAPADGSYTGAFQSRGATPSSPVGLSILYYRNQRNGKAVISSTNRLANDNDPLHVMRSSVRNETIGGRPLAIRESILEGPSGALVVWQWYVIDGQTTASDVVGKVLQAKAKLLFRGDDGAVILLSAPYAADAEQARSTLRGFATDNLAAIDAALAAARGR